MERQPRVTDDQLRTIISVARAGYHSTEAEVLAAIKRDAFQLNLTSLFEPAADPADIERLERQNEELRELNVTLTNAAEMALLKPPLDGRVGSSVADEDEGWEWAVVEIFGHRKHAGRVREEERFGAKMLRIDVPVDGAPEMFGWSTHYYGGSAIFSYALCSKEAALKVNRPYEPPSRLSISAREPDPEFEEPF